MREAEQRDLDPPGTQQARLIREAIGRALEAAAYRTAWRRLSDWASGAGIETAWSELHEGYERLLMILTTDEVRARLAEVDTTMRSNLKVDDPRLTEANKRLTELAAPGADIDRARSEIREFLHAANEAGDAAHANVRSFRNLLIIVGFAVIAAVIGLAVAHALIPSFIDLTGPSHNKHQHVLQVWEAEGAGSIGGLVAALFTISRLGGFAGAYRLPAYQALIRIPAGALIGLVAAVLIQAQFVGVLKAQAGLSLFAYSLVFGYAPDPLLRFMDKQAKDVLGEAQSRNDPARPPLAHPSPSG